MELEQEDITLHHVTTRPDCKMDGNNARLVDLSQEYMCIYMPGRSVYIDAISGTQYRPAEYFVLKIDEVNGSEYWTHEILRFPRSAI